MQDRSSVTRSSNLAKVSGSLDGTFWMTLGLGILIGVALLSVGVLGLFWFEVIELTDTLGYGETNEPICIQGEDLEQCVASAMAILDCPICENPEKTTPTATQVPTDASDVSATATAACAVFRSQFPATPCP